MNGVYPGMTPEEYFAVEAVNNSILKDMAKSPAHCYALHFAPNRPKRSQTASMATGSLVHCAVLEPHLMASRYVTKPEGLDMRTKAGKEWAESVPAGVEVISNEQAADAERCRAAVLAVPELHELFSSGEAEQSAFWTDDQTGMLCKLRADWVHTLADGRVVLVDLKTTTDASPEAFQKTVWNYGYHRQAAWYSMGWEKATGQKVAAFVFAAVTNAYPFIAAAHMLDSDYMSIGEEECGELLEALADCKATGVWPAFLGMNLLQPPAWARREEEAEFSYV